MTDRRLVRVLGPVRLPSRDGDAAAPSGTMPRRLLAALVLAGPEGRSVAALTEELWPEEPPRNPRAAIQMLVSRVRSAAEDGALESTATGYRVAAADLWEAERAGAEGAATALALWRGEPGADLDDDLAEELRERAARAAARLRALEAERLQEAGLPERAVPLLELLVASAPLDGVPVARLMRALADAGRTDAALAAFAAYREGLADALGADPDPEPARLNTALLRAQERPAAELVGVRAAASPLLGRDEDLARLVASVPAHRLTSLVGTGGLGKTRLAHETALRLADRFERIVFAELAGAQEAEGVTLVVGSAVGARGVQRARRLGDPLPNDLETRTREALAARTTLLVLDNCEHVVDAAARLAVDLLAAVPTLTVLTTSRVPLLVPGEEVVAPQPLPAPGSGAALFRQRALAARPGIALDPALVERVCARLDGLPLAIELAAARLRSMTLPELDARLGDRFAVLVGGDRTAPDRHRTLLAVIEWSRRLLAPAAAEALGTLAVLPDGFTAATADAVLGTDAGAVLAELVDQSLLGFGERRPGRARYRMLETVREYGLRDLAEQGRLTAAHRALDAWALGAARRLAPGLLAGADPAASRAVADEEETLLAVLRAGPDGREDVVVAVGGLLAQHWLYRGEFESVVAVLPALLAAAARPPQDPAAGADAMRALVVATAIALIARAPGAARSFALLRRALRTGTGDGGFWDGLGTELLLARDLASGAAALDRMVHAPDPATAAFAHLLRAQIAENEGDADAAVADAAAADALATRHGYSWFRFLARTTTVSLRSQQGRHAEALALARRVREDVVALDVDTDLRQLDWLIGMNAVAVGDVDEAERIFAGMAATTGRAGAADEADHRAISLAGLAEAATARGDRALAGRRWSAAVAAAEAASPPWRILVESAALAATAGDDPPPADLARRSRRLRTLLIAVLRLIPQWVDAPVLGAGLLGLSVARRREDPAAADALVRLALAVGARRDMPSLDAIAGAHPPVARDAAAARGAIDLLGSPALRR